MVSKYTLTLSTKNALPSGKHYSRYSSFYFKTDLVNTEPKFLIKLWPETQFVYLFIIM